MYRDCPLARWGEVADLFGSMGVKELASTFLLLSTTDEDSQASNGDGKVDYQEDVYDPGSSL